MPRKRNGIWYVDVRLKNPLTGQSKRYRPSLGPTVASRRMAVQAEREFVLNMERKWAKQLATAGQPKRRSAAFSGFARFWLDNYVKVELKPSTIKNYEHYLRSYLVPAFQDADLRDIDRLMVEECRANLLRGGLSARSVNVAMAMLSSCFSASVRWNYAETNPVTGLKRLRSPPATINIYDRVQTDRFLRVCREEEPDLLLFVLLGFRAGLRSGEIHGLRVQDVDVDRGRIWVNQSIAHGHTVATTTKSGRGRAISMLNDLREELRVRIADRTDGLVLEESDLYTQSLNSFRAAFERVAAAAGLHRLRFHDMRHSFASQLAMAGAPIASIQKLLGHADIRTTMIYAHLSPAFNDTVIQLLTHEPEPQSGHTLVTQQPGETHESE